LGELFKTSAPRLEPGSGTFAAFAEVISLTQSPPSTDFQICLVTKVTDRGVWNHCQETSIFVQSIQRCISPPQAPTLMPRESPGPVSQAESSVAVPHMKDEGASTTPKTGGANQRGRQF